jgi:tetratricopeptide (TPR) repeat protein
MTTRWGALLLSVGIVASAGAQQQRGVRGVRPTTDSLTRAGRVEFQRFSPAGDARATEYARRAIQADSTNGLAWALLAEVQIPTDPRAALASAERAVQYEPNAPIAWTALARAQQARRAFGEADRGFAKAEALDSTFGYAYGYHANLLASLGRFDESLRFARKARSLDAFWGDAPFPALQGLGRYDELLSEGRAGLKKDSIGAANLYYQAVGYALIEQGQYDEGLKAIARQRVLRQSPAWVDAWTYARAGQDVKARSVLEELTRTAKPTLNQQTAAAAIYANLKQPDSAFAWLNRASAAGAGLVNLNYHLQWKPLRSDPRFKELVRKVGLEK